MITTGLKWVLTGLKWWCHLKCPVRHRFHSSLHKNLVVNFFRRFRHFVQFFWSHFEAEQVGLKIMQVMYFLRL